MKVNCILSQSTLSFYLSGSIPQRITRRVNAEQPLIAGRIRKHCERRYEIKDPDVHDITILEKIKSLPSIFEVPKKPVYPTKQVTVENTSLLEGVPSLQTPEIMDPDASKVDMESILDKGFDLRENHYSKNKETDGRVQLPSRRISNEESLMDDSESIGELSEVEVTYYDCNVIYVVFFRYSVRKILLVFSARM